MLHTNKSGLSKLHNSISCKMSQRLLTKSELRWGRLKC